MNNKRSATEKEKWRLTVKEHKHVSVRLSLVPGLRQTFHRRTRAQACPVREIMSPHGGRDQPTFPTSQEVWSSSFPSLCTQEQQQGPHLDLFLQLGFPIAAVAASNVGGTAFVVEDVYNPWLMPFLSFLLALYLNLLDILKYGTPFCWNDK